MKFKKIITIGIGDSKLDESYWKKMDTLTEKRISLPKDSPEIRKHLEDADCVLVNPFVFKFDKDLIDLAKKLRFIGVLATGYNAVDFEYAAKKNVVVCNIPGYSTEAVAELAFASILNHMRDLDKAKAQIKSCDYSEPVFSNCHENEAFIDKLKSNAVLINLAPNELVDLKALENRLKKGDITYIFDHPDELTVEQANQLSKYKACIIYPPIGFQTEEARIAKQEIFVANIENFLKCAPTNKVN
ncbi:MAG: NAD(P)-dependent oxidoreductase [Nanoarchaeota archaeon]|nr:hypothetical protein [Nanoarchaeota archaeon]MBU4300721.1 hypothetical protein [Nanoarchaeota archaeon]MBU4452411.1 hypothetical protein [Nanoarchaeota archaeon]MCG2723313.1 hypothetical protein [archaeon]